MSCNYAEGLSEYEDKGILGLPEVFDSPEKLNEKVDILVSWILQAECTVVHTGAGISTAAGVPDFRGPNGVWTLEKIGQKPTFNKSFDDTEPTFTHMALKKLVDENKVNFIVSQNIDGLHLRSGLPRNKIGELHGNMYVEQCNKCNRQFVRQTATSSVGKKCLGYSCRSAEISRKPCRGQMYDTILDWEHDLPEKDLDISDMYSSIADLNICLGTTLQIIPSGNLPLKNKKKGGKLVICNLQPTKKDKHADLLIHAYVDDIFKKLMECLNLQVPKYSAENDPTKVKALMEFTLTSNDVKIIKGIYQLKCMIKKKQKRKFEDLNDSLTS